MFLIAPRVWIFHIFAQFYMALTSSYTKRVFHFGFDARTSRGRMKDKTSWFVKVWNEESPDIFGIGECGPLPGLSIDDKPDYEEVLRTTAGRVGEIDLKSSNILGAISQIIPPGFPSIRFGVETAVLDLINGGNRTIFQNEFVNGAKVPINGLVWMGDLDLMLQQVSIKISEGYRTLKIKIGGLNFEKECDILHYIRRKYFRDDIVIRLDANGSFKIDEALYKLNELAKFDIHSIEQPIKPASPEMEELIRKSPIPVAFDEELIGIENETQMKSLLERTRPHYIIIKPSLHGGIMGTQEWIKIAESLGIGWWMTSALESSIGLNAICQLTSNHEIKIPQGLGTGKIYDDNIASPLTVRDGMIYYDEKKQWDVNGLF